MMLDEEADEVFNLIRTEFDDSIAPEFTAEGVEEFYQSASEFVYNRPENHFLIVAVLENRIIGMIDVRDHYHICMFFVAGEQQSKGVGRSLVEQAISRCKSQNPQLEEIDVNSSTHAVNAYKKIGFVPTDDEQVVNGIRFIPMVKKV